jgi:radical SAM superfamily enzyme YgiQ (UPF0313 family)
MAEARDCVLLVNVPTYYSKDPFRDYFEIPLNLAYLVGSLKRNGIKVEVLDLYMESIKKFGVERNNAFMKGLVDSSSSSIDPEFIAFIREKLEMKLKASRYALIGVNADEYLLAFNILRHVKRINPKLRTVIGGHTATRFFGTFMDKKQVDFVIMGEGEDSIVELAKSVMGAKGAKDLVDISGLVYRDGHGVAANPCAPVNVNKTPEPGRDSFDIDFYLGMNGNQMGILSSRGCIGNCAFCGRFFVYPPRVRNPEAVIKEIKDFKSKHNIERIMFWDNTMNMSMPNLRRLCELMISERIGVKWNCLLRAKNMDKGTLALMKSAGCEWVDFGIETGSKRMMDFLRKTIDLEEAEQIIKDCKQVGLKVRISVIYGAPSETVNEFVDTLKFVLRTMPDYVSYNRFFYARGSKMYEGVEDFSKFYDEQAFSIAGVLDAEDAKGMLAKRLMIRLVGLYMALTKAAGFKIRSS